MTEFYHPGVYRSARDCASSSAKRVANRLRFAGVAPVAELQVDNGLSAPERMPSFAFRPLSVPLFLRIS